MSRSSGSDGGGRGFSQTAGEQEFRQLLGGGGDLVRLQVSRSSGSDGGGRGFSQTAGEQEFWQ